MSAYRFFPSFAICLLASACSVVYQHQDTPGSDPSMWGKTQIYRMWTNGWFQTNLSNRDRYEYEPNAQHQTGQIIFVADGSLYTMDRGGGNVAPVPQAPKNAGYPRWSRGPARNFILFSYPDHAPQSAIWFIAPDGSGLKQLTHPGSTQVDEIADSIDDSYIVFDRYDSANNQDRDLWIKSIWDDCPEVHLTNTPNISETLPVVSHDGTMLAYRAFEAATNSDRIVVARFANSPTAIVPLYTITLAPPADINISGVSFSRDDTQLFVSMQASDVAGNVINRKQEVFRIDLNGTNQVRLTNNSDDDEYPSALP